MKRIYLIGGLVVLLALTAFLVLRPGKKAQVELTEQVQEGPFEVMVTSPGELRAKNETELTAPIALRSLNIYQIKIADLIPEGTQVKEGDFVASLDKTEIMTKINEESINVQKWESEFKKAQLDTTLTLRQARDELINLKYAMEQRKLEKDQSKYEAPSVLRNAEIEFEKAERNYAQQIENYKTKEAQAKTTISIIGSDLSKAQNKLTALLNVLEELTINAPISGMVTYYKEWDGKKRIVGSSVNPWEPVVATLPDLTSMEVVTYVSEVDIQKVKQGLDVNIGLDSDPGKQLKGKILSVASIGEQKPNSDAKVFEVVITVLTPDTTLKPSMTTKCDIVCSTSPKTINVSRAGIYRDGPLTYVYKKQDGKIVRQEVKLGISNENRAVVTEGLSAGETIYLTLPKDTSGMSLIRLNAQEQNQGK